MRHNWKYIKNTGKAQVYIDYRLRKTKVITKKWTYIHNGIYPDQEYENIRRYKT